MIGRGKAVGIRFNRGRWLGGCGSAWCSRDVDSLRLFPCLPLQKTRARHDRFSSQRPTLHQDRDRVYFMIDRLLVSFPIPIQALTDRKSHAALWVDDGSFSSLFINLVQPFFFLISPTLNTLTTCTPRRTGVFLHSALDEQHPAFGHSQRPFLHFVRSISTGHISLIVSKSHSSSERSPLSTQRKYHRSRFVSLPCLSIE